MESARLPMKKEFPAAYGNMKEANPNQESSTGAGASAGSGFNVWSKESHTFCTECEDTRATVLCVDCDEEYCSLCWAALHRRGARAKHGTVPLRRGEDFTPPPEAREDFGWLAGVWPSHRDTRKTSGSVLPPDKDADEATSADGSADAANAAEAAATDGSSHVGGDNESECARATADATSDAVASQSQDRPKGYEGPLCPSGNFFSKVQKTLSYRGKRCREQDPTSSPATAKRGKFSPPVSSAARSCKREIGENPTDSPSTKKRAKTGVPSSSSPSGNKGGKGPEDTDASEPPTTPDSACGEQKGKGKVKVEITPPNGGEGSKVSSGMKGERNGGNCCLASSSSSLPVKSEAKPNLSASFSTFTGVAAIEAGVGEEDVGPTRAPTEEEAKNLANLKIRSTHVPLRLDEREREILHVLEGSLHHVEYTDAVDRILRGSRLPCVLKNLNVYFTSLWGMFKASGVTPTTYALKPLHKHNNDSNNNGINGSNNNSSRSSSASGGQGFIGPRPPPSSPSPPWSFRGASAKRAAGAFGDQVKSPGTNGAMASAGEPVKQERRAGGAAAAATYREDLFSFRPTDWRYTEDWVGVIRTCCEVGRRHKILNPEKMRSSHGMLMYILMDSRHPQVWQQTGFSCLRNLRTAFGLSASTNLLGIFEDPDLLVASRPVLPWEDRHEPGKKDSTQLADEAKEKAAALRRLVIRHGKEGLGCEVSLLVNSVADSIVYREISTRPIRRMLALLKLHWRPDRLDEARRNASLAVRAGEYGARLSHSHRTQFYFVLQSLQLWIEVMENMLDLWAAGEEDMLDVKNQYRLTNTGQGLQRVQGAPRVGQLMRDLQRRVMNKTIQEWVGSPVVHLGDNCVPNALTFLDKYSQVPYILNPILRVVDYLDEIQGGKDPPVLEYVQTRWPSVDFVKRHILRNFFKSGFDGSGANNSYDAGSCIDGRLTSAWNWCSKLEKKSFHHLFMCSGFTGFDGDFSL